MNYLNLWCLVNGSVAWYFRPCQSRKSRIESLHNPNTHNHTEYMDANWVNRATQRTESHISI